MAGAEPTSALFKLFGNLGSAIADSTSVYHRSSRIFPVLVFLSGLVFGYGGNRILISFGRGSPSRYSSPALECFYDLLVTNKVQGKGGIQKAVHLLSIS